MVPRGLRAVSIAHASIEIQGARRLHEANAGQDLKKVVERYAACYEYDGSYLYALARETKPDIVVETGVASGVSSYAILQAMEDNGKGLLYSVEALVLSLDPQIIKALETSLQHRFKDLSEGLQGLSRNSFPP